MAEIIWYGHACFAVRGRDVTVLMDPVPPTSGYEVEALSADIVTLSHEYPGHSAQEHVNDGGRLINGPGEYEIQEVFINGIQTWRDGERGVLRGRNTVYVLEIEDLVICHLGHIGHVLTEKQAEQISAVDVLLVPAGGGSTVTAAQAAEIIGQIEPGIIIPMQFKTEKGDFDREPVDGFLRELASAEHETLERLRVRKSDIGETARVVLLEPA
jgi:L-ascorbate metabolism protein UlaG (beta-lactamase superfamily)